MERVRAAARLGFGTAVLVAVLSPVSARAAGAPVPSATTFSIVASDTVEGEWGVAVASRILAVGSIVPWAQAGVGAVATQASANPGFGPHGLALLERGQTALETLNRLIRTDKEARIRQVGIVDAHGGVAIFTGDGCQQWAGGLKGDDFAVQGNFLAGPQVLDAMVNAFEETEGSLAERMLAALQAGDEAGGDSRGKQSAALLVTKAGGGYQGGNDRLVDLRVDDNPEPIHELERLYRLHAAFYLPAAHNRLGDQYLAVNDRAKADRQYARVVHLYRSAIPEFPRDARLPNGLAWFYVQHRVNLDEAFRLAQAAQSLDPRSWEIEDTLAEIHFARGNFKLAHEHALAAQKLAPGNPYLASQASRFAEALEIAEHR